MRQSPGTSGHRNAWFDRLLCGVAAVAMAASTTTLAFGADNVAPPAPGLAGAGPGASADIFEARTVIEDSIVKLYFSGERSSLPPQAEAALKNVVKEIVLGQRVVIATYGTASNPDPELVARRVARLRNSLKGLGLPMDKVEVRPPAANPAQPDAAWARRVDVMVVD